jgi:hypothetical protein
MRISLLFNPFNRIAGLKSLFLGLIGFAITTLLAFKTGTHFYGLLKIDFARDSDYWFFLTENLSNWIFMSTFMSISGLMLSKSKIRLIDIIGTTLLSRIPLIITPLFRLLPVFQSFVSQSWEMYCVFGIYIVSLIWTIFLLFHAFRISCNLKNERLIISFAASIILSDICTNIVIQLIT